MVKKTILVEGLFDGISEEVLKEKFDRFGSVGKIKFNRNEKDSEVSAAIKMEISQDNLVKCFTALKNSRWKGKTLKLQLENAEKAVKKSNTDESNEKIRPSPDKNNIPVQRGVPMFTGIVNELGDLPKKSMVQQANEITTQEEFTTFVANNKKRSNRSGESRDSDDIDEVTTTTKKLKTDTKNSVTTLPSKTGFVDRLECFSSVWQDGDNESPQNYIRYKNYDHVSEKREFIHKVADKHYSSRSAEVEKNDAKKGAEDNENRLQVMNDESKTRSEENKKRLKDMDYKTKKQAGDIEKRLKASEEDSKKRAEDNEKRLQAMKKHQSNYNRQKQLLQNALSNSLKETKKIIFSSDDENEVKDVQQKRKKTVAQKSTMNLFNEDDTESEAMSDDEKMFASKPQFEGEKGAKLFALQNRFDNDERFQLDEQFAEDESSDDEEKSDKTQHNRIENSDSEKVQNIAVFEKLFGKQPPIIKKQKLNLTKMVRYDPSNEEHKIFEIEKKKKPIEVKKKEKVVVEPAPEPVVPTETYTHVSDTLMSYFKSKNDEDTGMPTENNSYSVLKALGREKLSEKRVKNGPRNDAKQGTTREMPGKWKPRFDDESDDEDKRDSRDKINRCNLPAKTLPSECQKFFFSADDPRFAEGISFWKEKKVYNYDDWKNHHDWKWQQLKLFKHKYMLNTHPKIKLGSKTSHGFYGKKGFTNNGKFKRVK